MSLVKISASKLETFNNCSWLYYCKYILKIPEESNDGARRGNVCHLILECLLNPRHRKYYAQLLETNSLESCKAIYRLACKESKKQGLNFEDNIQLMNSMVMVALKYDFFGHGDSPEDVIEIVSEGEFNIKIEENLLINGFIDKKIVYKNKHPSIKDYKTSKNKFDKHKREFNFQALMYSLAEYKKTGVIPEVEFIFLRFPKNPGQKYEKCSEDELLGFEQLLIITANEMRQFDESMAQSNLAANSDKNRWLCGKENGWCCSFRKPQIFYCIKDASGKKIETSLTKESLKPSHGQKIYQISYGGCPAHNNY